MLIAVIGADGQLGTDLMKVEPNAIPLTLKDLDITNRAKTFEIIKKYSPDVVINTAAYHQVDNCEDEVDLAFRVNTIGTKYVADACKEAGACLVHISTDYVFDGAKNSPYVETDPPNPQSVYGISKLAGEYCVRYILDKYFIIRSSGLYGTAGCLGKGGSNFVENMISQAKAGKELRVVGDEISTPTYTLDLARKIKQLIRTQHFGLYHITNSGECSWYEFACKIFELLKINIPVKKVSKAEFPTKAKRPRYSVLKNAGLQALGMDDLRSWQDALKAYLIEKGYL